MNRKRPTTESDRRWESVQARRHDADGDFVYSVKTTGVYCRPSCPSRLPRRENVAFHHSWAEAERAGYRPCKRCRPHQVPGTSPRATVVGHMCRYLEKCERIPSLKELADHVGLSPTYTQRLFKEVTGVSPREYADGLRAERLRRELRRGRLVTEAMFSAGYGSSSRLYENSSRTLGMTPSAYRQGAPGLVIRLAVGECSLGQVLVAATAHGVCAILLGEDPEQLVRDLERRFPRAQLVGGDNDFEKWVAQVVGLIEQPGNSVDLPLDIRGTAFQQRVWKALSRIPAGRTVTYAELAAAAGLPRAVRAVAGACGANPLAVAIPCHRVVRADGGISGYRWGVERKRALLHRERIFNATRERR